MNHVNEKYPALCHHGLEDQNFNPGENNWNKGKKSNKSGEEL